jgi:hypothetical protein
VSLIAPIGPMRIAAVQPAQPGPGSDPSEDGLDVDVVPELAPLRMPTMQPIEAIAARTDSGDAGNRAPSAWAPSSIGAVSSLLAATPAPGGAMRGNAAVATGFDPTPMAFADAPRSQQPASPVARAYAAFAGR